MIQSAAGESNERLLEAKGQPVFPSSLLCAAHQLAEAAILWNQQHGLVSGSVLGYWPDIQCWKVLVTLDFKLFWS